jgi:hypothetical protein
MSFRTSIIATAALSLVALASAGLARAADLPPVKAAKPVKDIPFFLVIDDRLTYAYQFTATDPGLYSAKPGNTGWNGDVAKQVYAFTHFDVWAYGTNFFNISFTKGDHNDSSAPCINTGVLPNGSPADCAGATEFYGLFRSTFGWNEIFGTKAFSMGPLHNISFEIGADAEAENSYLAPAKRDFVAGLQFAFDLPYKGYINFAPLVYKEINHNAFNVCGSPTAFGNTPGLTCTLDGATNYNWTWALEINYYMDLGFLPESVRFFSISGRAGFYGPKGDDNSLPFVSAAQIAANGPVGSTATKTEINSEPIRLTFDASKAMWGAKYEHFVDVWIAYRYWQNKFGLDHNAELGVCNALIGGTIQSTHSCTEQTAYAGITVKF